MDATPEFIQEIRSLLQQTLDLIDAVDDHRIVVAPDDLKMLGRHAAELEQALHSARGTAFENPDTSRVSIGTIVTLRDPDSGQEDTYTILGAWDGDPERHIISYQTAIGQALMGHKVGDVVTLNKDEGAGSFEIISISAGPIDQTPVEVGDAATVDAVSA